MKPLLVVPLLLSIMVSNAQVTRPWKHTILFKNYESYTYTRIVEGEKVVVGLNRGDSLSGPIQHIRSDTIFIADTAVIMSDISLIGNPSIHNSMTVPIVQMMPHGYQRVYSGIKYTSDTSVWKPVYPGEEIYSDPYQYSKFLKRTKLSLLKEDREENHDPLIYNNFLKLNLARLIHLELSISYERVITDNFTWETEVSYFFGPDKSAYYTINYPLYSFNGYSVLTAPKFYPSATWYLSPVVLYRYGWFTGVRTDWPDKQSSGNGQLQDEYKNEYAGSLRAGIMKRYKRFILDIYCGAGAKYSVVYVKSYGGYEYHDSDDFYWYNDDHSPNIYTDYLWNLVLNAGIKIGIGF